MVDNLIKITLLTVFASSLLWLVLVPIWHTPDEQAHFGEVAFMAEKWRLPDGHEFDLTEEIYVSEQKLGTVRDKFGNNKFTFHPEYKIDYSDNYIGPFENEIISLNNTQTKTNFVTQEAARYSKLYYLPAALIYKLFYFQDLFTRVYLVRFWSVSLFLLTIYFSLQVGRVIFPKDSLFATSVSILVGLQPMMIFSNIGVNSDSLGNLIFTLFILTVLRLIKYGFTLKNVFFILIISTLGLLVKPQFFVMVPILFCLFIFVYLRDHQKVSKLKIIVTITLSSVLIFVLSDVFRYGPINYIVDAVQKFNLVSFLKYTREYTLTHTISEVMPWYWGIYDWLGVTYARTVHRIINRLVLVSLIGFIYWLVRSFWRRDYKKKEIQSVYFLLFINILYFLALSVYDWFSWYTTKYQLGIQGRYFFPLISSHIVILLLGWQTLLGWSKKLKYLASMLLEISMVILNFIALYTISSTYYNLSSFEIFNKQASQYKPWFIKGPVLTLIIIFFLFSVFKLIYARFYFLKHNRIDNEVK